MNVVRSRGYSYHINDLKEYGNWHKFSGGFITSNQASISACEKASQWQMAVSLMKELTVTHVKADVVSYGSSISACQQPVFASDLLAFVWKEGTYTMVYRCNPAFLKLTCRDEELWRCDLGVPYRTALFARTTHTHFYTYTCLADIEYCTCSNIIWCGQSLSWPKSMQTLPLR